MDKIVLRKIHESGTVLRTFKKPLWNFSILYFTVQGLSLELSYTVKIISDKLRHVTGTFGGFDSLLLQAK